MLSTTSPRLRCPICASQLSLHATRTLEAGASKEVFVVQSGHLACEGCKGRFPILAGVAILVEDVRQYLLEHVKGLSRVVPDSEIPRPFRREYLEAKAELEVEHIEEDLEAERVISLYLMNHYLSVKTAQEDDAWWKPLSGAGSPLIDSLVREHWDLGPLARIASWMAKEAQKAGPLDFTIELGCGVGGFLGWLRGHTRFYLGVDSSFASIALGRHLALGVPYSESLRIPEDLLRGPVSRPIQIPAATGYDGSVDLVVGDMDSAPVAKGEFDAAIALNAIDMLPEPEVLPRLQHELLKPGGLAVQSCPYIWHETVARELREALPEGVRDSAAAVEWLYEREGLRIEERVAHLPWLFFKHVRQLEIYSVHLFRSRKGDKLK